MSVMPAEELEDVRSEALLYMNDTCSILRQQEVDTDTGTRLDWVVIATSPVRYDDPLWESERIVAERVTSGATVTAILPVTVDIKARDRIQTSTGFVIEVISVQIPRSYEISRRAVCRQVL